MQPHVHVHVDVDDTVRNCPKRSSSSSSAAARTTFPTCAKVLSSPAAEKNIDRNKFLFLPETKVPILQLAG